MTNPVWVRCLRPNAADSGFTGRFDETDPREVDLREVVNTILYLNRTGCQWDMLPHDLLPKSTVYDYFAQWRDDGTWQTIVDALRIPRSAWRRDATDAQRHACIDSQSVKTTEVGGESGLRRGQEDQGAEAAFAGRYAGLADGGAGSPPRRRRRRGRSAVARSGFPTGVPALETIFGDSKYHNHQLDAWLKTNRAQWQIDVTCAEREQKDSLP